jgi:hypothetical protein
VSRSLLFEHDPVDQPAATIPVERLTWCALRIRVGQRIAGRIFDRSLQSERTNLYLPAFPIAEWLVQNWWALLNEPCRSDKVPGSHHPESQLGWIKRHCLRSADSALMLPALYVYHDGQSLRAVWQSNEPCSMPNMPGEFVSDGDERLDDADTRESLAGFISETLNRVSQLGDERVRELRDQWHAIQAADVEEQQFCTLAGRMGIDPYDEDTMTDELAQFLETVGSSEDPLIRDLTEVATADSIAQQWSWVRTVSEDLGLAPSTFMSAISMPSSAASPPHFGYDLARAIREAAAVPPSVPVESVEAVAESVIGTRFRVDDRNHMPGDGVRAIVGQSGSDVVAVGPLPGRDGNRRFLTARSLYHALVTAKRSHRLVTNAFTWHQKASRAFAAELLAPQRALLSALRAEIGSGSDANPEFIDRMGSKFRTSPIVIEKQLENAGISVQRE